jgi:K+-sensing histidine kinase KdpD
MKEIVEHRGRTTPIELTELISDIVAEYEQAYPTTSFGVDCPPSCTIAVTPDITHALENLVENAAEHNPYDDAEVRVTLNEDANGVVISVEDNGPGIPSNELTVLERGYEDVLNHGSGIGLWIVTMVIDEIDGTVQYDSDDDGTKITLRIEN